MNQSMPDSGSILRLDRATGVVDTVGKVKLQESSLQESGGAGNRNVRNMPRPLTAQDAWAVSWDGRVAVARSGQYSLDWIQPDGSVVSGKPVPYEPLSVTGADKEAWVETLTGGLAVMVSAGGDGRMQTSFSRGGVVNRQPIRKRDASHHITHDVDSFAIPTHLVNAYDIRMIQLARRTSLA